MAQVQTIQNSDIQSRRIKSLWFTWFLSHLRILLHEYLSSICMVRDEFCNEKCYPFNVVVDVKEWSIRVLTIDNRRGFLQKPKNHSSHSQQNPSSRSGDHLNPFCAEPVLIVWHQCPPHSKRVKFESSNNQQRKLEMYLRWQDHS